MVPYQEVITLEKKPFNRPITPRDTSLPKAVIQHHQKVFDNPGEWYAVSGPHPKNTARTYAHRANTGRKWRSLKTPPGKTEYRADGNYVIARFTPKEQ